MFQSIESGIFGFAGISLGLPTIFRGTDSVLQHVSGGGKRLFCRAVYVSVDKNDRDLFRHGSPPEGPYKSDAYRSASAVFFEEPAYSVASICLGGTKEIRRTKEGF